MALTNNQKLFGVVQEFVSLKPDGKQVVDEVFCKK